MKKKIIGIFVCMLMMTTCVIPVSSTICQSDGKNSTTVEIPDSHIIENIPYVCQGDRYYCIYASITMIFQYYGLNTSLFEVCFNSGVGYSFGYVVRYPCLGIWGALISSEAKDRQFLADIYGLNYSYWNVNDDWQIYWTSVKENISKDIPVTTEIYQDKLPYYEPGDVLAHSPHTIVLSGYNETNHTVSVHDSAAPVGNNTLLSSGAYIWIPIDSLKNALVVSSDKKYLFEIFVDTSEKPLLKKDAFELAHARNIQRMMGNAKVYDKEFIRYKMGGVKKFKPFLGMHALEWLKHSYNIRNIVLFSIYDKISGSGYFSTVSDACWWSYAEKLDMSQYLREHVDWSINASFEADLLEIEADIWAFLSWKAYELYYTPTFRIPAKISIMNDMRDILDVIISIEEEILHGPPSE
ncbi:Uncharacterised protein [uncultured archaeon]|nr:Uncharacterised protein [uncultured archaeon]